MRRWAFATSPHGLGMDSEEFWDATTREYAALRDVYDAGMRRWALEQALFANAHFRERNDRGECVDAPFTPDDFLGCGDREKRTREIKQSKLAVMMANTQLNRIQPGVESDDVPAWAKGAYHAG